MKARSIQATTHAGPDASIGGPSPGKRTRTAQLQRRARDGAGAGAADAVHGAAEHGISGAGEALPHGDRIAASFGRHDVSDVVAHVGGAAAEGASEMGAIAFATGNHVAFARSPDLHTAAHEAAHVVQQRAGVHLKDGVGAQGDAYERNADDAADAVVAGRSAEPLLEAFAGGSDHAPGGVQRAVQMENESSTTEISAHVVGHASPRWEQTRGRSRDELNLALSQQRADAVRLYLEEMLNNAVAARGLSSVLSFQCLARNHDDPGICEPSSAPVSTEAQGHQVTTGEAGGNPRANDPAMRRADIAVTITWRVSGTAPSTRVDEVRIPRECDPNATDQWAVKLSLTGGGGHAGVGAAGALGVLKNRLTGQVAQGSFQGGGLGVGLSTPGADPGWGSFENFTTDRRVTFEDFDGTLARLTTLGAGIAIIGYSFAYLSFPNLGANSISVGGANMGALGADGGSNVGWWNVIGTPPGPICRPERTEHHEVTEHNPYQYDVPTTYRDTVSFETGSAEISDDQLMRMQAFVDSLMPAYDWPGHGAGPSSPGPSSPGP
jgi:hypothetical protein